MKKMVKTGLTLWAYLLLGSVLTFGAEKITWEHIVLGPGGAWFMVKVDPQNDDVVYISSDMRNWAKSTDGGKTWIDLTPAQMEDTGAGGAMDYGFLIDPNNSDILYLATYGVAKSLDGGKSWKHTPGLSSPQRLAMDPTNSKIIYCGSAEGKMYKTENAGDTWTELPGTGFREGKDGKETLRNIIVGHDRAVYVCMFGKGILKNIGPGQTWTTNNVGLPHLEIGNFQAAIQKDKTVLYALLMQSKPKEAGGKSEGGLYRSVDGANTWEKVKVLDEEKYKGRPPHTWCQMAVSPVDPNIVYLAAGDLLEESGNKGVYRTLDGGKTWTFLAGKYESDLLGWNISVHPFIRYGYNLFAVSSKNPKKLYRGGNCSMYRSDDGGESWKNLSQEATGEDYYRSTGLENICVIGIVGDPKDSRRVYLGAMDNGFFKSRDGGKTWKGGFFKGLSVGGLGVRTEHADQILVDPDTPATLYIGHASRFKGHFAISRDYGETWERSNAHPEWGLPKPANIIALTLDPDSPAGARVLYASLIGEGVWKTENGGLSWKHCHQGLPEVAPLNIFRVRAFGRQIIQLVKPKGTAIVYAVVSETCGFPLTSSQSLIDYQLVTGSRLYRTENKGETWSQIQFEGTNPTSIKEIAVDPKNPAMLYAACVKEGVWKSADRGKTWQKILGADYPNTVFYQVAVDNFNSKRVYAAGLNKRVNYGVWMSEDGGSNWTHEAKGFGHWFVDALYADPTAEGIIWTGTRGNAVFKGYVKGVASPKEIKEPARSPLEDKKSPVKGLTDAEVLEKIKSASLIALKADAPMTMDGDLKEPAWSKATEVTGFYETGDYWRGDRIPAPKQTRVKALYDNDFLYLGIVCEEPDTSLLNAEPRDHDNMKLWTDDTVEVRIAKGLKGDEFQFMLNSVGARLDAAYGRFSRADYSWKPEPDWQVAVKKGKTEWTVEMAIPLKAVGGPGSADDPWRIKIYRNDTQTPSLSSWPASTTGGFVSSPALFAPVIMESSGAGK